MLRCERQLGSRCAELQGLGWGVGPGGQDTAGDPVCTHLQASLLAASILPVLLQRVPCPERRALQPEPSPSAQGPPPGPSPGAALHLAPGPLQGPLEFAEKQHSTGGARTAGADGACRERGSVSVDGGPGLHRLDRELHPSPEVPPPGVPQRVPSPLSLTHLSVPPWSQATLQVTWVVGHALEGTVEVAEVGDEAQRVTPGHYRLSGHHRLEAQLPLRQLQRQGRGFQSPQALQL